MEGLGKPRIVALPLPAQGHLAPMMHLCGHLTEAGFSVTVVIIPDRHGTSDLIKAMGTWPPPDITLEFLTPSTPFPPEYFLTLTAVFLYARNHQLPLQELIANKLGAHQVVCLICDYQLAWGVDVAAKLGIPGAVLFTGCATWSWIDLHMPRLVSSGDIIPVSEEVSEEDDHVLLEHPRVLRSEIPRHFWNDKGFQEYTVKYNSGVFERARWVLCSSAYELEPEMIEEMRREVGDKYMTVGPLFLLNKDPTSVSLHASNTCCMEWLDKQPVSSVIYIAFGSTEKCSAHGMEQLEELAKGVEASRQRFLWVSRSKDNSQVAEFYAGFQERNKERGVIVSWAPQTRVLSHASVGAFLSHSGWNSTMEAVTNGKPILSWPCDFDQYINRRLIVEDWKVGTGFVRDRERNLVESSEVERVIRMVMEGDEGMEMRRKAHELSSKLKTTNLPGGSSYQNLQRFHRQL